MVAVRRLVVITTAGLRGDYDLIDHVLQRVRRGCISLRLRHLFTGKPGT